MRSRERPATRAIVPRLAASHGNGGAWLTWTPRPGGAGREPNARALQPDPARLHATPRARRRLVAVFRRQRKPTELVSPQTDEGIGGLALLVAVVVAIVAVLAAWKSDGKAEPSGLYGSVRIPQSSSLCPVGRRCPPARNRQLVFTNEGNTIVALTDGRGRFRVLLEPGRYEMSGLAPAHVTVRSGHFD